MLIRFNGGWVIPETEMRKLNAAKNKYNDRNGKVINVAAFIAVKTGAPQVFVSTFFQPGNTYIGISNVRDHIFQGLLNQSGIKIPGQVQQFDGNQAFAQKGEQNSKNAFKTFWSWCFKQQSNYENKGFSLQELSQHHSMSNNNFTLEPTAR